MRRIALVLVLGLLFVGLLTIGISAQTMFEVEPNNTYDQANEIGSTVFGFDADHHEAYGYYCDDNFWIPWHGAGTYTATLSYNIAVPVPWMETRRLYFRIGRSHSSITGETVYVGYGSIGGLIVLTWQGTEAEPGPYHLGVTYYTPPLPYFNPTGAAVTYSILVATPISIPSPTPTPTPIPIPTPILTYFVFLPLVVR